MCFIAHAHFCFVSPYKRFLNPGLVLSVCSPGVINHCKPRSNPYTLHLTPGCHKDTTLQSNLRPGEKIREELSNPILNLLFLVYPEIDFTCFERISYETLPYYNYIQLSPEFYAVFLYKAENHSNTKSP